MVQLVCLQFLIVVFSGHTDLLFSRVGSHLFLFKYTGWKMSDFFSIMMF